MLHASLRHYTLAQTIITGKKSLHVTGKKGLHVTGKKGLHVTGKKGLTGKMGSAVVQVPLCRQMFADTISKNAKYSNFSRSAIYNYGKFTVTNDFVPLVFYVHSRPRVFSQVIEALRLTEGIEGTVMIVFFDDYIERESYIQRVVSLVTFCQLIVVRSPAHIPAQLAKCEDIDGWDTTRKTWYLKWHWLGLQTYVFKNILSAAPFHSEQDVAFLEEDHMFVSIDAYLFLKLLCASKNSILPPEGKRRMFYHVSTVSLATPGGFEQNFGDTFGTKAAHEYLYHSASISEQFSNTGYAYNRTFWERISSYEVASPYQDWDWTLFTYLTAPDHSHENYHLRPALNRIINLGVYCSDFYGGSSLHNHRPWGSTFNCSEVGAVRDFRVFGKDNSGKVVFRVEDCATECPKWYWNFLRNSQKRFATGN